MVRALPHGENRRHDGSPYEEKPSQRNSKPGRQLGRTRGAGDPRATADRADRAGREVLSQEAQNGGPQAEDPLCWPHESHAQNDQVSYRRRRPLAATFAAITLQ